MFNQKQQQDTPVLPPVPGKRLSWIDYARGITIILVLYRHVYSGLQSAGVPVSSTPFLQELNIVFFSFRMPLFFIISGLFINSSLAKRTLEKYLKVKVETILYPYVLWAFIQLSLQIALSSIVNSDRTVADYLNILYNPRELEQFWYLYALFNVSALYALVKVKLKPGIYLQIAIGMGMYLLSTATALSGKLYFVYDILHYYIFFALGDLASRYVSNTDNFKIFESFKTTLVLLPLFAICQYWFLVVNMENGSDNFMEENWPLRFIVISLTGCIFLLHFSFVLQKSGRLNVLRILGKHSLYIYATHVLVTSASRIFCLRILHISQPYLLMVICILLGLVIPVMFYQLTNRFNMWWLWSLQKPKKAKKNTVTEIGETAPAIPESKNISTAP